MGRRKPTRQAAPTAIPGSVFEDAIQNISRDLAKYARYMHDIDMTPLEFLTAIYGRETVDLVKKVQPLLTETYYDNHGYELEHNLEIMFPHAMHGMVPMLMPHKPKPLPIELVQFDASMRRTIEEFTKVRFMLGWFQDNATAGALRHYWPACAAFLPKGFEFPSTKGAFREPKDIGRVLPLLRETATFVAAIKLMPQEYTAPPPKTGVTYKFSEYFFQHESTEINMSALSVSLKY